jgi:hypothetical protein
MHCMIDLETLGTGINSVVLSLGAVKFNPNHNDSDGTEDKIYLRIDAVDCQRYGLVIEAGTVMWWLHPDREAARKELLQETGSDLPLDEAVHGFKQWYESNGRPTAVWSNGSTFDIMIMRNLFRLTNHKCPWSFREERCFRTYKELMPAIKPKPVAHHALADALEQARMVQVISATMGVTL